MANFDTQIQALAGTATQTEMDDWAADGVKEIINILPPKLKQKCATYSLLNADNGTTLDLDSIGNVLYVTRENANSGYYIGCREISPLLADSANDSSSLNYATATDPVYWTESNSSDIATLFVKPTPTNNQPAKAYHITYPTVDVSSVSTIANFPDEAEYLVVLYAAIKVLHNKMNELDSNNDITTALTAVNTELDETQSICDLINTQVDSAVSELSETATNVDSGIDTAVAAITTALGRVNTAVALANTEFDLVNAEVDLANAQVDDEDIELAQGYLATAQGYTGAGNNYIGEAQASLSEAQGYVNEVNARGTHVQSQLAVVSGYINAAQGYASEIQSKIGISQGYIAEANTRMAQDNQKYQWYQAQQAKLQQDYDKGIQMLVAEGIPQAQEREAR